MTEEDYITILKAIHLYADSSRENVELNMYWAHVIGELQDMNREDLALQFAKIHNIGWDGQEVTDNMIEMAKLQLSN